MRQTLLAAIGALSLADTTYAGIMFKDIRPRDFPKDRKIDIHVGQLVSSLTTKAYDYTHLSYCELPRQMTHHAMGEDGTMVESDVPDYIPGVTMYDQTLHESFFQYKMGSDKNFAQPCTRTFTKQQISDYKEMIQQAYKYRLYIDGMPNAVLKRHPSTGEIHPQYDEGVPVGKIVMDEASGKYKYALYNHWILTVKKQKVEGSDVRMRIVGFEVEPRSYYPGEKITADFRPHRVLYLEDLKKGDLTFGFSYVIKNLDDNETMWVNRMEHYLKIGRENIHLAAILISLSIIILLMIIIAKVMQRSLNQDVSAQIKKSIDSKLRKQERAKLPAPEDGENRSLKKRKEPVAAEDVAWKKVHGDVFRPPIFANILCCFVGAGFQLWAMFFTLLLSIVFAFANTEWRSSVYTMCFVTMAIFGFLNGYVTSRYLKFFGTTDWNFSATVSSLVLPLFITGAMLMECLLSWIVKSSLRYSFGDILFRVIGWYLLNGTMCYYGAFKGYLQKATELPSKLNKVVRPIPDQPLFMSIFIIAPVFGLIQFAGMYAEFSYLVDSIFKQHMYAMFTFLLINGILQSIVISLLAMVQTYMQLSYQNYDWWWRSFFVGGAGGIYVGLYLQYFLIMHMNAADFATDAMFLIYAIVFIGLYVCAAGAISVNSSYYFVSYMYKDLKCD